MARSSAVQRHPKYLKDHRPSAFAIPEINLYFNLHEDFTEVKTTMKITRTLPGADPLKLDGVGLKLTALKLNGERLAEEDYEVLPTHLTLNSVPDECLLEIWVEIAPQNNTRLQGLYRSGSLFCTQCESHGFRNITYFLDRPDVMSAFTTTIEADQKRYPVLLSNGDCISTQSLPNGRHVATWRDPFKKPAYLFALVAGDLDVLESSFETQSGKKVALKIYTHEASIPHCHHAMASLKKAMRWDEETFNLEYDLNTYMIVAVDDFNQGAMENKGLNIFNTKYILASPQTATDTDYQNVEAVVGHEYFHNWTGNRVTLRDWFQLSLKEGLTVYREHRFSEDVQSQALRRIEQIDLLRNHQFPEDAGPFSHPVRPSQYIEMNNFYTMTVYEKGAELIRMLATIIGEAAFKKGMALYFERHDGKAVTVEDFIQAMADASHEDLSQFILWYSQSGTPRVQVNTHYDERAKTFTIDFQQTTLPTQDQKEKVPLLIPITYALWDPENHNPIPLKKAPDATESNTEALLLLEKEKQTITLYDCPCAPIPSLLRGFSAPVRLECESLSSDALHFLFRYDTCSYIRWDAFNTLKMGLLKKWITDGALHPKFPEDFLESLTFAFESCAQDPHFFALLLMPPEPSTLIDDVDEVDLLKIKQVLNAYKIQIATALELPFSSWITDCLQNPSEDLTPLAIGKRALKNRALAYLATLNTKGGLELSERAYNTANNMTDTLGALSALVVNPSPIATEKLADFRQKWQNEPTVMNKWFALQAASEGYGTLECIETLIQDPKFSHRNPNNVHALLGTFGRNFSHFHTEEGTSYQFMIQQILSLDSQNPMLSARLLRHFSQWQRYNSPFKNHIQTHLQTLTKTPNLSPDLYEILSKLTAVIKS